MLNPWLLKSACVYLESWVEAAANASVWEGIVLALVKDAAVRKLKKSSLDSNVLNNKRAKYHFGGVRCLNTWWPYNSRVPWKKHIF